MTYVVSDLHGYPLDLFLKLLEKAGFGEDDTLYVLGDVIDRGNHSVELLTWIMEQKNVKMILGNHESMLLKCDFMFETEDIPSVFDLHGIRRANCTNWLSNGGYTTLDALSILRNSQVQKILDFLHGLPLYEQVSIGEKKFLLTHSGLDRFNVNKPLEEYTAADFIWCRPSINAVFYEDKMLVFGHTPTVVYGNEYAGKPIITDTWVNVDCGVAAGYPPSVLRLNDFKIFS